MTNEQLAVTLEQAQQVGRGRFASVGDISCDIGVRNDVISEMTGYTDISCFRVA